jgi:hypothetical protein
MAKSRRSHKKRSKSHGKKRSASKKGKKRSKSKGSRKGRKKRSSPKKRRSLNKFQIYMRSALKKAGLKGKSRSSRAAIFAKVAHGWSRVK